MKLLTLLAGLLLLGVVLGVCLLVLVPIARKLKLL